jgi:hypothetical protein
MASLLIVVELFAKLLQSSLLTLRLAVPNPSLSVV